MTPLHALQLGAVIATLSVLGLWAMCHCAKPGWQDSDGFHAGEEPFEHSDYTDPNGDR